MSTEKAELFIPLEPSDVIQGDPVATIWRWCAKNRWVFVPDLLGGEPWIDQRCAWALVKPGISFKTAKNDLLAGLERVHGLVRLSEVLAIKQGE